MSKMKEMVKKMYTRIITIILAIVLTLFSACSATTETSANNDTESGSETMSLEEALGDNEYLPLGSIILPAKSTKRVMIVGRYQKNMETGNIFDYSAVKYPEGYLGSNQLIMFNNEQIDEVFFVGYTDEQEGIMHDYLVELDSE